MAFLTRKLMYGMNETVEDCYSFCQSNYCHESCTPYCPGMCQFDGYSHPHKYTVLLITTLSILGAILAGIVCSLCVKLYLTPSRRRAGERNEVREEFPDGDQGSFVDHHVWYINTIGLQPSVISSISICRYKKGEGLIEGTECSVCLNEFQEDETVRLLPKCSHAFHIPCIDTWLRTHVNCPMCRAPIVSSTAGEGTPTEIEDQLVTTRDETLIENSENSRGSIEEAIDEGNDSICEDGCNLASKTVEKPVDRANWGLGTRRSISLDISSSSSTKQGSKYVIGENDAGSVRSSVVRSFSDGGKSF